MAERIKRLRIFAGPNGSGKSTLYDYLVGKNFFTPYFHINPDNIFRELSGVLNLSTWPFSFTESHLLEYLISSSFQSNSEVIFSDILRIDGVNLYLKEENKKGGSYLAAALAEYFRRKMLLSESSFSFETVLSHPSKVDFIKDAKDAGYKVYMYFISTSAVLINKNRVQNRVARGGHTVPMNKIEKRYTRTLGNLYSAVVLSDRVFFFDNSEESSLGTFKLFAEKNKRSLILKSDYVPQWFSRSVLDKIPE